MTVLKHFHLDHFATLFQVVTVKHFANDWFETFPHWSLYFPFPGCHCETLWQWLFWNTSTWITLLPLSGCHCETLWQWLFWNISTLITATLFQVVTVKHFDNDCFETLPQWSLCYPFLGCRCETLWQWLLWNISTMITLLPFFRLSLWNTLTMTVLKHFHNDHFATLF